MKRLKKSLVADVLFRYRPDMRHEARGYDIRCPFHNDTRPSCTVFYDTGKFSCFSCGCKSSALNGFKKLGATERELKELFIDDDLGVEDENPSLESLAEQVEAKRPAKTLVIERETWPQHWSFRGIRSELLTGSFSPLVKLFSPALVRLCVNNKAERFPRLALKVGEGHEVYLRTSGYQKIKIINSPGLVFASPKVAPFGLPEFKVPKQCKGLFLVEGPYDLLKLTQHLIDCHAQHEYRVIALLGVTHWAAFLKKFTLRLLPSMGNCQLIPMLDNDRAGLALRDLVLADTRDMLAKPVKPFCYTAHDPGDSTLKEFKEGFVRIRFDLGAILDLF